MQTGENESNLYTMFLYKATPPLFIQQELIELISPCMYMYVLSNVYKQREFHIKRHFFLAFNRLLSFADHLRATFFAETTLYLPHA